MRTAMWISLAVSCLAPITARAQALSEQLATTGIARISFADTTPPRAIAKSPQPKSEGTALALSLGTTLGLTGLAAVEYKGSANSTASLLLFSAFYIGPATGYWYAGSPEWKKGFLIRTIGLGMGAAGALIASSGVSSGSSGTGGAGSILAIAGAGVIVVDAIIDIAKVKSAVRAVNATRASVEIVPLVAPDRRSAGLDVRLRF